MFAKSILKDYQKVLRTNLWQLTIQEKAQNDKHDKAREFLKSKGYDVDAIKTSEDVFDLWDKLFDEWHKNPADKMPYWESNKVWEKDYKPAFDALNDIETKLYYDEYYTKYPDRKKIWK